MVVPRRATLSAWVLSLLRESHAAVQRKKRCGSAQAIVLSGFMADRFLLHCEPSSGLAAERTQPGCQDFEEWRKEKPQRSGVFALREERKAMSRMFADLRLPQRRSTGIACIALLCVLVSTLALVNPLGATNASAATG